MKKDDNQLANEIVKQQYEKIMINRLLFLQTSPKPMQPFGLCYSIG